MPKLHEQTSTRHIGAGLTMAVVVGLFATGGYWLDQRTGWTPLFVLLGVGLGGVGGFLHVVRVVSPEMLPWAQRSSSGSGGPPESPEGEPAGSGDEDTMPR